jgi:hypothetical protein
MIENNFINLQMTIIDNLGILKNNIEEIESRIITYDPDESIYNKILSLIKEAESADSVLALSEVIEKAKTVEHQLDLWYSREGIETFEIDWPDI